MKYDEIGRPSSYSAFRNSIRMDDVVTIVAMSPIGLVTVAKVEVNGSDALFVCVDSITGCKLTAAVPWPKVADTILVPGGVALLRNGKVRWIVTKEPPNTPTGVQPYGPASRSQIERRP